jgi:hypothetical protein
VRGWLIAERAAGVGCGRTRGGGRARVDVCCWYGAQELEGSCWKAGEKHTEKTTARRAARLTHRVCALTQISGPVSGCFFRRQQSHRYSLPSFSPTIHASSDLSMESVG